MELLGLTLVCVTSGWLANILMRGSGLGFLSDTIIGIFGALVGGLLFHALGLFMTSGSIGSLFIVTVGAISLIAMLHIIKKA